MTTTVNELRLNELRTKRDRNGELLASAALDRIEELLRAEFPRIPILEITAGIEPGDHGEPGFTLHKVIDGAGESLWDINEDDTFNTLAEIESLLDEMGSVNPSDYESMPEFSWAFDIDAEDDEYVNVSLTVEEVGRILSGGVVLVDVDTPEGVGHPDALGSVSVLVRLAPQD